MIVPRPYQLEAERCIEKQIGNGNAEGEVNRTLLVLPTGTGKTTVFGQTARGWDGRVLVLAHRNELIVQARDRLEAMTGAFVDVEKAESRSYSARCVVGSMQSVAQKRRLHRLGRGAFSLIIIDEAHRSMAASYRKIIDWFHEAKVLGVTATPDRGDRKALGGVFESLAYEMSLQEAVIDGWLVNVKAYSGPLKEIDLSQVKSSHGDLVASQLDDEMVKASAAVAEKTCELVGPGDGQGIAFFPGVQSGMLAEQWFNKLRPGCARFVCGTTDTDEREEIFRGYKRGDFQWLVNVMIATEGFDHPPAQWVIPSPTKSRGKYAQMCGRVTRTLPGVVDGIAEPLFRRQAIAESAKPHCTILDYYGNTGKHDLAGPADILGGKYSELEIKEAKRRESKGESVLDSLEMARAHLKKVAEEHAVRMRIEMQEVDAFLSKGKGKVDMSHRKWKGGPPATDNQLKYLKSLGVKHVDGITANQARSLIGKHRPNRGGSANKQQLEFLGQYVGGLSPQTPYAQARNAMNYVNSCRKNNLPIDTNRVRMLATPGR